jgi:Tol biopolymer transport system component
LASLLFAGQPLANLLRAALPGFGAASGAGAPAKLIQSPALAGHPAFSPDGKRVAFASNRSGSYEIWTCGADGLSPAQLTHFNGAAFHPAWSPDGRQLAFSGWNEEHRGRLKLYMVDAEGGKPRRVTADDFDMPDASSWSRDGKWIYFSSDRGTGVQVWKAPANEGPPVPVTQEGGLRPMEFFRFDTGARTQVVKLGGEPNDWVLYEHRNRYEANIMLAENFR